ncbi:MAG: hypothetical protein HQM08_22935 [Candidatus Riflebacteria bacterium]|nr:hypothetical protein [Candidatus Riflebacteria bacterium]
MDKKKLVEYHFLFEDGKKAQFKVNLERAKEQFSLPPDIPKWTELSFNQCDNCSLSKSENEYCPTAVDISEIVSAFSDIFSFTQTKVTVKTPTRNFFKECDTQSALNSLLGVVMASSACPILSQLKPLAVFHLPFASIQETIYRTVGNYLIRQYFANKEGKTPDLELNGLQKLYKDLQTVNNSLTARIRKMSEKDSNPNAIISWFGLSTIVQYSIDKELIDLKELF